MFKMGLCSVTFRELNPEQIIELAEHAGIEGIEWGGDIHVPPGDFIKADEVAELTTTAGLNVAAYGSYYRAGHNEENEASFERVLQTAIKLNAPSIRVWAGKYGSNDADENYWHSVISDSKRIASMAADHGISINFEYHGGTLTDTKESARKLMKEVKHPNVGLYWQPAVGKSMEARIESIKEIQRWLTHVHVFHWEGTKRLPLFDGEQDWIRYLRTIGEPAENRYLMLEFVKDDHKVQFLEDAGILKSIIETASA